jgi:uncharacterized protein YjiS (DUF1127 family)
VIRSSEEAGIAMLHCKNIASDLRKRGFSDRALGLRFNRKHYISQLGLDKKQASIQGLAAMSFHDLIARYRRWKSIHETIAALECLTTGELDDLGIARRQIAELAKRHGV